MSRVLVTDTGLDGLVGIASGWDRYFLVDLYVGWMHGRETPQNLDAALWLWATRVTAGKHPNDFHEDIHEVVEALTDEDAEEIIRAGSPAYDKRFSPAGNELLLGLRVFAFNRTACWDTFRASVDRLALASRWSPEEARELAAHIVGTRVNGFMPTVAQIQKAASDLFRRNRTLDDLIGILLGSASEQDTVSTALAEALIYHAYEAGARSGMSPEQLEILGKFLIKKSKEVDA